VTLASFNVSSPRDAESVMLACCASRRFARAMAAGRPYPSADAVAAAVPVAFESLTWDDVVEAMSAHPRIGARVSGRSAAEQSGVGDSSRAALATANVEYEARFGHVFLICATGLSGEQMLTAARQRLTNDLFTERTVATAELEKITAIRVRKALGA
jgi:2-oxo-4-hydroxy-4-carboxy-5-ureidoimidazoline decarboxylase